jgi:hypothetical protein
MSAWSPTRAFGNVLLRSRIRRLPTHLSRLSHPRPRTRNLQQLPILPPLCMPTLQIALTILSRLRRTLHPNSRSPRPHPFLLLGVNDSTHPPVVPTTKTLKLGKLLGRSQPSPRTASPLSTHSAPLSIRPTASMRHINLKVLLLLKVTPLKTSCNFLNLIFVMLTMNQTAVPRRGTPESMWGKKLPLFQPPFGCGKVTTAKHGTRSVQSTPVRLNRR